MLLPTCPFALSFASSCTLDDGVGCVGWSKDGLARNRNGGGGLCMERGRK
jgi:hypothetical protein